MYPIASHVRVVGLAALLAMSSSLAHASARVVIVSEDDPGVGLNDPTPRAPIGGNTGTTVGEQRRIALQHAADLWSAQLDSPVEIRVAVGFFPLPCFGASASVGQSGPWSVFTDFGSVGAFPGPVRQQTWHFSALADKRAGYDLEPGEPDLESIFNINLGAPNCSEGSHYYYGLDGNEAVGDVDLVAVALHEFAHGFGFLQLLRQSTGALFHGLPSVFETHVLDTSSMKTWEQMTDAERMASIRNMRRVVWDGTEVSRDAAAVLDYGLPTLVVTEPASIARSYEVGEATFGPRLSSPGVTARIVLARSSGSSDTDGCNAITNARDIAGQMALVDRGNCTFVVKAANLQAAGAAAMIMVDNVPGAVPNVVGGFDPTIAIPVVRITLADGAAIKAQLATGVDANLGLDLSRLAGVDTAGRMLLNATNPLSGDIAHWDPIAFKNQLMEPSINPDLTHELSVPIDLTVSALHDLGWFPDADNDGHPNDADACATSDTRATLIIDALDTGVPNVLLTNGCTISDYVIGAATRADTHGAFVSEVARLSVTWRADGLITDEQRSSIQVAAAHSSIGSKLSK